MQWCECPIRKNFGPIIVSPTSRARLAPAMPLKRTCPALELRTRHCFFSPSSARANVESSSDQKAAESLGETIQRLLVQLVSQFQVSEILRAAARFASSPHTTYDCTSHKAIGPSASRPVA